MGRRTAVGRTRVGRRPQFGQGVGDVEGGTGEWWVVDMLLWS